jgi:hypothetical protein
MPADRTIEPPTDSSSSESEAAPSNAVLWALLKQLRKEHDRLEARVYRMAIAGSVTGAGVGVAGTIVAQALGGP